MTIVGCGALVTGGGRRLGLAIVERLADLLPGCANEGADLGSTVARDCRVRRRH